ncbi:hypothetical protein ScPMuIL_011031 [Solemya velum]
MTKMVQLAGYLPLAVVAVVTILTVSITCSDANDKIHREKRDISEQDAISNSDVNKLYQLLLSRYYLSGDSSTEDDFGVPQQESARWTPAVYWGSNGMMKRKVFWQPLGYVPAAMRMTGGPAGQAGNQGAQGGQIFRYGRK